MFHFILFFSSCSSPHFFISLPHPFFSLFCFLRPCRGTPPLLRPAQIDVHNKKESQIKKVLGPCFFPVFVLPFLLFLPFIFMFCICSFHSCVFFFFNFFVAVPFSIVCFPFSHFFTVDFSRSLFFNFSILHVCSCFNSLCWVLGFLQLLHFLFQFLCFLIFSGRCRGTSTKSMLHKKGPKSMFLHLRSPVSPLFHLIRADGHFGCLLILSFFFIFLFSSLFFLFRFFSFWVQFLFVKKMCVFNSHLFFLFFCFLRPCRSAPPLLRFVF